jgi:hypothetical protein
MSQLVTNLHVQGHFSAYSMSLPTSSVTDDKVSASADISASKLEHQHQLVLAQAHGVAASDERRVIHVVKGATGTVVSFRAGVVVANIGNSTITVDLRKNGTTILTSVITLDSTNVIYVPESAAGFTSTALVANDVLEVIFDATVGTGTLGQGAFADLVLREDAA